jgi:hypothetical protein
VPTTRTPRRWRTAAAGLFIAASAFTVVACGEDVVDDDIEQDVEDGVDEVEEGVEDATDGPDDENDG